MTSSGASTVYAPILRSATVFSLLVVPSAVLVVVVGQPVLGGDELVLVVAAAGLLVGIPHGALDHLVPAYRAVGRRPGLTGALVLGYAACVGSTWWLWHLSPATSVVLFLALSCAHFGAGEVSFARLRSPEASRSGHRLQDRVHAAVLGSVVVVLPLASHPDQARPFLRLLVPGWDGVLPTGLAPTAATVLVLAAAATTVQLLHRAQLLRAAESVVLLASALIAPAVVSIAVYFGAWHSIRHLAVLVADDPANRPHLLAGRLGPPVRRLARQAAVPSAVAIGVIGALWWHHGGRPTTLITVAIPWIAALTVPHVLVVWWADRTRPGQHATAQRPAVSRAGR